MRRGLLVPAAGAREGLVYKRPAGPRRKCSAAAVLLGRQRGQGALFEVNFTADIVEVAVHVTLCHNWSSLRGEQLPQKITPMYKQQLC